jgi:hypothetical protein
MDSDIPLDLVCPLLNPNDLPTNLVSVPVVAYNHFREIVCFEITDQAEFLSCELGGYGTRVKVAKPSHTLLAKVFRHTNLTGPDGSGSGTPLFLVFQNSSGQRRFVYYGHLTNTSTPSPPNVHSSGPHFFNNYGAIINACKALNTANGFAQDAYLPTYVTDSYWPSSLQNGLVSYWKMNEGSGTRNDSHGTNHLTQTGNVLTNTGKVYSLAADLDSAKTLETYNVSLPGSITVSVWCYVDSNQSYALMSKGDWNTGTDWSIAWLDDTPRRFRFSIGNADVDLSWFSVKWNFDFWTLAS